MANVGPTTRELLSVLQPQMDRLNAAIGTVQADTTYLRECAVRDATQLAEHERRLGKLENCPTGARLSIREALIMLAGGAILGGGAGAGLSELLKFLGNGG